MADHPNLKLFRGYLDKQEVNAEKANNFDKWRNGPKCTGEIKEAADQLWVEYQADPAKYGQRAPKFKPAPRPEREPRPERGRGGPGRRESRKGGDRESPRGVPQGRQPERADNAGAGDPSILGLPFHNPYTFIPFAKNPPKRRKPTPLTIDERERDRFTGIIDLEIRLLSPLLTAAPDAASEHNGHRTYDVLAIGSDVIVPATGVRGALRSLLAVLTGGTLGHIDEEAWLCQGRDARLGPASKQTQGDVPDRAFLAEVVKPGGRGRPGTVRVGKTRLVKADDLDRLAQRSSFKSLPRPRPGQKVRYLWTDEGVTLLRESSDSSRPWKVKLSGRPVNRSGKREGLSLQQGDEIELPSYLWGAYGGRHRHADHPELRAGDLVWLEPHDKSCTQIKEARDVKSLQWARWGREGERLLDVVARHHPHILPDCVNPDGMVDEITDLFGQVPRSELVKEVGSFRERVGVPGPAGPFAARVRPTNLVFHDAVRLVKATTLAPLAPPHPGCAAFYRDTGVADLAEAADRASNHGLPLRGYKVYRTTSERGQAAPWRFEVQGVYGDDGRLKPTQQKVNKTCQLLPESEAPLGKLRLSVRGLSQRELTLLFAACSVDWRLGGGKPLGLGHCRVERATARTLRDDGTLGEPIILQRPTSNIASLPAPLSTLLANDPQLKRRLELWQAAQTPVNKLRYPRAVSENKNKKSRGGHVWFQRHAQPKKVGDGDHPVGLQTLHVDRDGPLGEQTIANRLRAQPLPPFDPNNPQVDLLYGHDAFVGEGAEWVEQGRDRRSYHKKLEPFDEQQHARSSDKSGGSHSQTREKRQQQRKHRPK